MADKFTSNQVINGTYGRLWLNGELLAEAKSFEAKVTLNYEKVDISEELGEHQKYTGFSGAGTLVLHKIDSNLIKKMASGIKTGELPDLKFVGRLADPNSSGQERVEIFGVTIDEVTLMKWAVKTLGEEEVPFKFSDFNFQDTI